MDFKKLTNDAVASTSIEMTGHVHIVDDLGKELLSAYNAVHPQNMATLIARGLAHEADYWAHYMYLGNGGASIGAGGAVTYLPPNTSPSSIGLYNKTYEEIIDEDVGNDGQGGPANSVTSSSGTGVESIITVVASLAADQPVGQSPTDQAVSSEDTYSLDEIGLVSPDGLLLSHITFSPVLKSANRAITITYTITITVSNV